MTTSPNIHVTLEQAKLLVEYLETEQQQKADDLVAEIQTPINAKLYDEIGKLTRQLHESLNNFQVDSRLNDIATADIPDAKERLNFVITRTEEAANNTMDAVESIFPVIDNIQRKIKTIDPVWQELVQNKLDGQAFKQLCDDIDSLLKNTDQDMSTIHSKMTSIIMAQDFQDITGQIIRQVIDLVRELEENLIGMLTAFGLSSEVKSPAAPKVGKNLVEGPIVNAETRTDAVSNQNDVDDLLSSLGF